MDVLVARFAAGCGVHSANAMAFSNIDMEEDADARNSTLIIRQGASALRQWRVASSPRSAARNSLDGLVFSAIASFATSLTVGFRTPRSTPET